MKLRHGSPAAWTVAASLVIATLAGCASVPPLPPASPRPTGGALGGVQRVVVVASGESAFAAAPTGAGKDPGSLFGDIFKWFPQGQVWIQLAELVYRGVTWLIESERAAGARPRDVTPSAVVATAFARTLQQIGPFDHIVVAEGEPGADVRRAADAIVRISVPAWGFVAVRESTPPQVAGFADVRAQVVRRETGVVAWEHDEDVTHPERLPLDVVTKDRELVRDRMSEVLERAGRRLATELVYWRSAR